MSDTVPPAPSQKTAPGVLVVEDEELVALYLEDTVDILGYRCCARASTADQALTEADAHRPAIALVDIGLKGARDGISLAEELKGRLGVEVIFLSGAVDPDVLDRARAVGPSGILSKPYEEEELAAAIQAALSRVP